MARPGTESLIMEPQAGRPTGPPRGLTVYVRALMVFDLALATAIAPLLPYYTHAAGLSKPAAGILMASYPLGILVGALPAGLLAGRLGPRACVLLGLAVTAAAVLAFGWSSAPGALAATRFAQGLAGSCVWVGGLAWLAAATPLARRGEALGPAFGFAAVGTLVGPVIGAFAHTAGTRLAFTTTAAAAAGLMAAAALLPGPPDMSALKLLPAPAALRDRAVGTGVALTILAGMTIGALEVLAPLRLSQLGASVPLIAGVFFVAGCGEATLSPLIGKLSDRRGEAVPARFLLAAAAVVCLTFPLLGQVGWLAALLALGMPALGSLCVPGSTLLSAGAERLHLHQGVAFGAANCAWSAGQFAATAAAGAIAHATSDFVPCALLAGLCVTAAAALLPASPLRPHPLPTPGAAGLARPGTARSSPGGRGSQ
ncbi:MAG TPA: MFS transporter [Streptosporangiaceae bacterium]|nr:MFS transporter [Streptosporangiaceae bacterium]